MERLKAVGNAYKEMVQIVFTKKWGIHCKSCPKC